MPPRVWDLGPAGIRMRPSEACESSDTVGAGARSYSATSPAASVTLGEEGTGLLAQASNELR